MPDGSPLRREVGTTTGIAREAVKRVYQHVSSPKDTAYLPQRDALALCFRQRYGCDADGIANAIPFFIGVFDTVASLGSYLLSGALIISAGLVILAASFLQSFFLFPFLPTFLWSVAAAAAVAVAGYVATHLKYAAGLEGYSVMQTLHLVAPKMKFYDLHLDNAVVGWEHSSSDALASGESELIARDDETWFAKV
jgi:hypothetical protein